MPHFIPNAPDSETSSLYANIRQAELDDQHWNRNKSADMAKSEGISLNDEHWAVIVWLRRYYLEFGLPRNAWILAKDLNQQFSVLGGNKYLASLFPGGPVLQGSRFANLRTPANATDISFGSSY